MALPVPLRRAMIRLAYRALLVWWRLAHPHLQGVKCVLRDGDRVLLVRHTYGPRQWDLPGGRVERGEAPSATAQREMSEELGLEREDWRKLGELEIDDRGRHDTLHCFAAAVSAPRLTLQRSELADASWFPAAELPAAINPHVAEILALQDGPDRG